MPIAGNAGCGLGWTATYGPSNAPTPRPWHVKMAGSGGIAMERIPPAGIAMRAFAGMTAGAPEHGSGCGPQSMVRLVWPPEGAVYGVGKGPGDTTEGPGCLGGMYGAR